MVLGVGRVLVGNRRPSTLFVSTFRRTTHCWVTAGASSYRKLNGDQELVAASYSVLFSILVSVLVAYEPVFRRRGDFYGE